MFLKLDFANLAQLSRRLRGFEVVGRGFVVTFGHACDLRAPFL